MKRRLCVVVIGFLVLIMVFLVGAIIYNEREREGKWATHLEENEIRVLEFRERILTLGARLGMDPFTPVPHISEVNSVPIILLERVVSRIEELERRLDKIEMRRELDNG